MKILVLLGIIGLIFIAAWALPRAGGLHILVWSLITAFAALVVGGALGLLFGLPTAQTGTVGAGPASQQDLGYRESTSLEQVADWLTKILIGLTLTQYNSWEEKYTILSQRLTDAIVGGSSRGADCAALLAAAPTRAQEIAAGPECTFLGSTPIPGGVLVALYSMLGFLVSYLWMRRYFIHELVSGKEEAKALLKQELAKITEVTAQAEKTTEEARRASDEAKRAVLQETVKAAESLGLAPAAVEPVRLTQTRAAAILRKGEQLLPPDSKGFETLAGILAGLEKATIDPEDPWRNEFGASSTRDGVMLEASVVGTPDPNTFKVDLVVRGVTPERVQTLMGTKAIYYLHPTFGDDPRVSAFGADGRAPLELYAYGAFTTGVVLEDGTMLELNLATLPGAPDRFRSR
jgi:hypothetical protein